MVWEIGVLGSFAMPQFCGRQDKKDLRIADNDSFNPLLFTKQL